MSNNLIELLDSTFPGANTFFDSTKNYRDGHQKWVDFDNTYWHVDCVRRKSRKAFTEHYQKWCKHKDYLFSPKKANEIYDKASDLIAVFPKDENTKMIIREAVNTLNNISATVENLRFEMNSLASQMPEYPIVMAMNGVGASLGPQLIAEIGDVTR